MIHAQVAQFSAEQERYVPAIEIYEDVAVRSMDNNLLKFSAKGYLLNAGICRLCGESPRLKCQHKVPVANREGVSLRAWQQQCLYSSSCHLSVMHLKSVRCKSSRRTQHCC